MCSPIQSPLTKSGRFAGSRHLRKSDQSLTIKKKEISVARWQGRSLEGYTLNSYLGLTLIGSEVMIKEDFGLNSNILAL